MKSRACIVGVGSSELGKVPHKDTFHLALEAAGAALADAQVSRKQIDGLLTFTPGRMNLKRFHIQLAEHLGIQARFLCDSMSVGGASSGAALQLASWAVTNGHCKYVLIAAGESHLSMLGRSNAVERFAGAGAHNVDYEVPYGASLPSYYGLVTRRHMHEFGTTSEQLAAIAVACRKHASMNPVAMKRDLITVEDVMQSRMIADPLHLLDCCLIGDGGGAFVVTTEERARDLPRKAVSILGTGQAHSFYHMGHLASAEKFDLVNTVGRFAAENAFADAGVKPDDIDVLELYDSFTITVLVQLEDFGFCKKGEGGPLAASGALELGGRYPTNTHGGCLSAGQTGVINANMFHVIEAVNQLRGKAGPRQVADAKLAFVSSCSAVLSNFSVAILGEA